MRRCVTRLITPLARLAVGSALLTLALGLTGAEARDNPFKDAKSWAFQLKNLGPAEQAKIAASPYDMVVIDSEDYPNDETERALTPDEVNAMKKKPDGSRRLVIAYFSIGEAESYRFYWKPEWNKKKPSWVGKENKEWKENYVVKFWDPAWQAIVFGNPDAFADRIIAQGFDGFYLDRADAYYYLGNTNEVKQRMRDFVIKLSNYIRAKKPDIGILVQNAEELLDNKPYIEAIDGIAKEDLLFGISYKEEHNTKDDVEWSGNLLKAAQKSGKKIFVIEYLTRNGYIAEAKKRLDQMDMVLYTGPRGLGEMQDPNFIPNAVAAAGAGAGKPIVARKTVQAAPRRKTRARSQ